MRPSGRPNVLYFTPNHPIENHIKVLDVDDMDIIRQLCCHSVREDFLCSSEFFELAIICMQENGLGMPNNAREAFILYQQILNFIQMI